MSINVNRGRYGIVKKFPFKKKKKSKPKPKKKKMTMINDHR